MFTFQNARYDNSEHKTVTLEAISESGEVFPYTYRCDGSDDNDTEVSKAISSAFRDNSFEITEYTAPVILPETLAAQARDKRNKLLSECDYYIMPDYPSVQPDLDEVRAYRQSLRDISSQSGFPESIEWPAKPECLG